MSTETFQFEAEINKLLGMIVKSFYSNKDIFLRELISNSADALEKLRRRSLESNVDAHYEIRISYNKENKQLVIADTGIGMTHDELKTNLGTIAKSGTADLLQKLKDANTKDSALIGQFGVGFYSLYLIGDRATVVSKSIDSDKVYEWSSTLDGSFSIKESEEDLKEGTKIIIDVKDSELSYLDESVLKRIIETHSLYIRDPIYLLTKKARKVQKETEPDEVKDDVEIQDDVEKKVEEVDEVYYEYDIINNQGPIWEQTPSEVTDEQYANFYNSLAKNEEYLDKLHCKVDGSVEFTALLYVPKNAPFDLFREKKKESNVKLYKNRVLITDDCKDIIPEYFNFFKGVIDSNDISLNVSREMLQKSVKIKEIKKHAIKKMIRFLQGMRENVENYKKFYTNFHKNIKLGIHEDKGNQQELATLLQYYSLNSQDTMITLDKYIENKKEDQNEIYYQVGDNQSQLQVSPFMTYYKNRGIDVLFCVDNIDEYCLSTLEKYKDLKLVDITKKKYDNPDAEKYKKVCEYVKQVLKDKVENVVVSSRELEEPAIISSSENGISSNMERIIKAQAYGDDNLKQFMKCRKVLELNPNHELVKHINNNYENSDTKLSNVIEMIFSSACLCSGFDITDPVSLGKKLNKMLCAGLGLDIDTSLINDDSSCNDSSCNDSSCNDSSHNIPELDTSTMDDLD